jgi:hypothetical protein
MSQIHKIIIVRNIYPREVLRRFDFLLDFRIGLQPPFPAGHRFNLVRATLRP